MKLNVKQTVLIGLSFASILAFWQFYDHMIPIILENHYRVSTLATNFIMSIDNILAVFMLPFFGALSDNVRTPLGKRTPFILGGTVAAVLLMTLLAFVTESAGIAVFIVLLMLLLVTMSVYRSPAVAYMPDVTPKPLRSKGNAVINLVGYVGGIFSTIAISLMVTQTVDADGAVHYGSFIPIFLTVACFMLVTVLVMVLTVNENRAVSSSGVDREDGEKSVEKKGTLGRGVKLSLGLILVSSFLWFCAYNGVTTSFSRYFEYRFELGAGSSSIFLTVATVAAIISFVPLGFVSGVLGRKKTVLLGIVLMTVCYISLIFISSPGWILYLLFSVVGVGWAAINVNSFPMVVEMCSSGDIGRFTGLYYAFTMSAQIVTPLLSGLLIDENAIGLGYGALFPYATAFSCASLITMLLVRHGDSRPQKKDSILESFEEL